MLYYLVTVLSWTLTVILLVALFPVLLIIWLVTAPFKIHFVPCHYYNAFWAWITVKINPFWKLTVIGRNKINHKTTKVFISNHQSMVDVLILFPIFTRFRWVSKIENFKVPIGGWAMEFAGYIKLDRNHRKSFPKMYQDCKKSLQEGVSVMIFPEGTRSVNGDLGNFKEGAFRIALENKVGIQPIILEGSFSALTNKKLSFRNKQKMVVKVLDEIPYDKLPFYESAELSRYFRDFYEKQRILLKNEHMTGSTV